MYNSVSNMGKLYKTALIRNCFWKITKTVINIESKYLTETTILFVSSTKGIIFKNPPWRMAGWCIIIVLVSLAYHQPSA